MGKRKVLMTASVASMIDQFNMDNMQILEQLGYEIHVACNFEFGNITSHKRVQNFQKELQQNGVQVIHVPIPRSVFDVKHILQSFCQIKQLCRQENYQLIHTQSPIGGAIVRLAAKGLQKNGTKLIYTAHGFHFFQGAAWYYWLLFYPVEKYLSKYTDILITINREDFRLAHKLQAGKVCYVPGAGIDIDRFAWIHEDSRMAVRKRLRAKYGFQQDDFVLLSVGQLSKRKNQKIVIQALSHINDVHVKYLIAGIGELMGEDKRLLQKLQLRGRVVFAGYCENVEELLHMADCFVFPSLQEGLPVALMEAMAAGVPVICSSIRGNTDLIADGVEGRLVAPNDIKGYVDAILELMSQPQEAQLRVEKAYRKVKRFSKEKVNRRMRDIYGT